MTLVSSAASSARLVEIPVATLNAWPTCGVAAASRLARAMSAMWTKSIVWLPSPRINGGSPASIRSIQRTSTSV